MTRDLSTRRRTSESISSPLYFLGDLYENRLHHDIGLDAKYRVVNQLIREANGRSQMSSLQIAYHSATATRGAKSESQAISSVSLVTS